jgi:hypothetical protein
LQRIVIPKRGIVADTPGFGMTTLVPAKPAEKKKPQQACGLV